MEEYITTTETIADMWRAIHEANTELQRAQDPEHIAHLADSMTWHIPITDWTAVITAAMQEAPTAETETWQDLPGAANHPAGYKWQSNGKSRFNGDYKHRLIRI